MSLSLIESLVRDAERAESSLADHDHAGCDHPPRVRRAAPKAPKAQAREDAAPLVSAPGVLGTREEQGRYILSAHIDAAGHAHGGRFTLVSRASGARYTYRVRPPSGKPGGACRRCDGTGYWQGRKGYPCRACDATGEQGQPDRLFVAVLTGPDNTERGDYTYLGQIIKAPHPRYEHGGKSRIGADALSARAAHWYFTRLFGVGDLSSCEFWHDGVCGRCGKDLTNPPSVACGYGEECADKLGIPWG